ncbi:gamma-glutamyl-gamma-aminobutyrate hydrolase family protein [Pediococcus argentinicus]|uniref:gamma-glutamyl-gamma-aminobutyrate hydrolase family protein n=1 Tax=Pediococcus argentinicus TaxID=480391 RepID=UPI00338D76BC
MQKKVIGIVANRFEKDTEQFTHEHLTYTMQGNIDAIEKAGALPLLIPIIDPANLSQYLDLVDAIFLPGGQDVQPKLYGEEESSLLGTTSPKRDTFEMELIKLTLAANKPILAICRGAQLVNVYFGGTLYQDETMIPSDIKIEHDQVRIDIPNAQPSHLITIQDSHLEELLGSKKVKVNSLHHQAIHELGQGLKATSKAADGVVESFINPEHHITAYQWHPEMQQRSNDKMLNLFKDFLKQNF